jgi:ABC-type glycerol-3-phosphate transport system substrate-binding protein
MKTSRRQFLKTAGTLGASTAAVAAIASCAPPPAAQPSAPAAEQPAAPAAEQPAAEAEPTAAPAAAGGTVKWAEFYSLLTDESGKLNQEWLANVIKQFQDENPGWTVEQEAIKWDQIDQKAILDLAAGVDHDLMFSSPQLMAKHAQTGTYIDLTPMLQTLPEGELADLEWSPGYKAASVAGQQVGLATGVHTRTNVYNRDMFTEAGLDPDKAFTTLEEVVDAGQKLTKAEEDIWGLGLYLGPSRATIELYYAPIVWANGGDFFDATAKKATLTGEPSVKAAQWLYDCVKTWKITPPYAYDPTATYDDLIFTKFTQGKVAQGMGYGSYWIGGVQAAGMYENCFPATADCKVGTAGVMVQPGAAKAQFTNAWCLSLHKLSTVPDAAFKLLMTVMEPENLKTYPDAGLPGRLSAWEAPEYSSAFYQTWLDAAKNGKPMPPTPYYAELADAVAAAMQEILSTDADIAATMQKTEEEWNAKYAGQ